MTELNRQATFRLQHSNFSREKQEMAMDLSINMDEGEISEVLGKLIPEGVFLAKITEVAVNPSKSEANKGKPVLQVDFKIVQDGSGKGRRIRSWLPVWKGAHFRFGELLVATGMVAEGDKTLTLKNPADLLNQEVLIKIKHQDDSREDHADEKQASITKISAAGGVTPGTPVKPPKAKVGFGSL